VKIWSRIKRLSSRGLLQFGWLFLKNPLLVVPTLNATKRTFQICNDLYGNSHHKSNKANAFRHALWNILICLETSKKIKNSQKSVVFTEKVTTLYEKATKNELLDEAMDLRNNEIGRALFFKYLDKNEEEIVDLIQKRLKNAQKVSKLEEIQNYKDELVYISD